MFTLRLICNNAKRKPPFLRYINTTSGLQSNESDDASGSKSGKNANEKSKLEKLLTSPPETSKQQELNISKETESTKLDGPAKRRREDINIKLKELIDKSMSDINREEKIKVPRPKQQKQISRPVYGAAKKAESKEEFKLIKSVKEVADDLGGDVVKTEKALLDVLMAPIEVPEEALKEDTTATTKPDWGDLLGDMEVSQEKVAHDRFSQIKKILNTLEHRSDPRFRSLQDSQDRRSQDGRFSLFSSEGLSIFDDKYKPRPDEIQLETWNRLKNKELKRMVVHSPRNVYEEMIKWTNEGKLWHFPIDNEWKWSYDENVDFSEHILLEQHLDSWCPPSGPIRHFMELVCVGLSKNFYMSAEIKRGHLEWYRNFFEDKKQLLQEIGAMNRDQSNPKEITGKAS